MKINLIERAKAVQNAAANAGIECYYLTTSVAQILEIGRMTGQEQRAEELAAAQIAKIVIKVHETQ